MLSPNTPQLAALDLFVSVVELGSVSKAAAAHQISQPSASSRINYLEKQLGIALLERTPTGSAPTPEGTLVAGWAEGVLRSASELTTGVDALKAKEAGKFRVAASLTNAEYLLPVWLEKFLRNRPSDSIQLEVTNSANVLAALKDATADLGFIESAVKTPGMNSQVVAEDRLVVVVGPAHPWAKRKTVSIDALVSTPLILREVGSGTRDVFETALLELGYDQPPTALELGSTTAVRSAVMASGSPTVISETAVAGHISAGSLAEIEVTELDIRRQLRAVWPKRKKLPELALELLADLPSLAK